IRDSGCRLIFADPKRITSLQQALAEEPKDEVPLSPGFVAMDADPERSESICGSVSNANEPGSITDFNALLTSLNDSEADTVVATRDIQPDDDASIMYTSGSTDHPKGVLSSHRAIISALYSWLFV